MIILLNTSTPIAQLVVVHENEHTMYEWEADRQLAKGLLGWIEQSLQVQGFTLHDIDGIGVFKGPGSFTGLRIGITVANTLADSLNIAIIAASGEDWQKTCNEHLARGNNDGIALPLYDRDANITKPRK